MIANKNFFRASAEDFKKIPGSPVAYWVSERLQKVFLMSMKLADIGQTSKGIITGDNGRFMRTWWEVAHQKIGFGVRSVTECVASAKKWFPCNKGGGYRKWYGNNEYIIDWADDGYAVMHPVGNEMRHCQDYYAWCKFQPCVTWTSISSSRPSFRYKCCDLVDHAGMAYFMRDATSIKGILGFANSKVTERILNILSPTLNFNAGEIGKLPIHEQLLRDNAHVDEIINMSKFDWDRLETSWDFTSNPLIAAWNSEREKAGGSSGEAAHRDMQRRCPKITFTLLRV